MASGRWLVADGRGGGRGPVRRSVPQFRGFPHLRKENWIFAQFLVSFAAKCERNVNCYELIFEYVNMLGEGFKLV